MADDSADERRKATKDAVEKCSETVNRAMVSFLAVSLFCLLTTLGAADRPWSPGGDDEDSVR